MSGSQEASPSFFPDTLSELSAHPGFLLPPQILFFFLPPTKGCQASKLLATAKKGQDIKITHPNKSSLFLKREEGGEKGVNKICVLLVLPKSAKLKNPENHQKGKA